MSSSVNRSSVAIMLASTLASKPASIWVAVRAGRPCRTVRQDVDVDEVSCGSSVEQGEQLVAGEFFRCERRPGCGRGGRKVWWRINGQIDQDSSISTADDHPAECVAVMDSLRGPASLAGCGLQGIARGGNVPVFGGGEEVKVLSGPGRQVLRKQGGPSRQQEALTDRQAEEQPGHLKLESRQVRLASARRHYGAAPVDSEISGAHADRILRGRTRSSQRSTSSAPST